MMKIISIMYAIMLFVKLPETAFSSLNIPSSISSLETEFVNCILEICRQHSTKFQGLVVTSEYLILRKSGKLGNSHPYEFIAENLLYEINNSQNLTIISNVERNSNPILCFGNSYFPDYNNVLGIFIIDTIDPEENFYALFFAMMSCLFWRNPDSFFIIVDMRGDIPPGSHETIFSYLWNPIKAVNVIIVHVHYKSPTIAVHGWIPSKNINYTNWKITSTSILNYYNMSSSNEKGHFFYDTDIFPPKQINDFQGNTLVVKPDPNIEPLIFQNMDENSTFLSFTGPLIYFLETVSTRYNFKILFTLDEISSSIGNIYGPFMLTESIKMYNVHNLYPICMGGYLWYVPMCRMLPYWSSIIRIFRFELWMIVLLSYLFTSFTLCLLESKSQRNSSNNSTVSTDIAIVLINTMLPLIAHSGNLDFKKSVSTLLFSIWMFYSLQINTAYQSSLVGYLTNPGNLPPLQSIKDLDTSDVDLIMVVQEDSVFDIFSGILRELGMTRVNDIKRTYKLGRNLSHFIESGCNVAFLAINPENDYVIYTNGFYNGKALFIPMEKEIMYGNIGFSAKNGRFLYKHLNRIFLRLQSSGIYNKWIQDIYKNGTNKRAHEYQKNLIALSLKHLEGPFYFLALGLAISSSVVIFEIIFGLYNRRNNKIVIKRRSHTVTVRYRRRVPAGNYFY
ncbi:Ionotropic receptor 922 [Blattella germanica]|nr:Ionotropic receptor 922 [Blattella germanica]